jgi:hypothetical protein
MPRYIDADVLHIQMEDLYEHHIEMKNFSADGAVADCLDLLDNAPTADVVEVKHGEWIYNPETLSLNSGYTCSVCKDPMWHSHDVPQAFKYCPNCGARMDGDVK